MLKTERAEFIRLKLDKHYPDPPIPLSHKDPYTLLVAVLLSAQCTDERVNKVTPGLFALADNPAEMSKLSVEQIDNAVRSCGLSPRKAQSILGLSKIIDASFQGKVPPDMQVLETFPGVGHKTASVVMSQAFGVPSFPVDTHIHRLAQRWGLTSGKNVKQTEADLKKLYPPELWNKLHLQIIYYGREFCSARSCDGTVCEICRTCYPNRKNSFQHQKA